MDKEGKKNIFQCVNRCTPVCSKIFESNETMPNENKHNDIKQNRQFGEAIRNISEMNISRVIRCTPVCSKIFESNETMANENKHNDIEQNRQVVEPIRNVGERNICRISNMKKSI